ncbi:unnamed protein product [Cyprideis torosa]|uniref:Uncharacterized protein n=1 Tax=Cyprideis torosa TaxID=163714 RepID=A0A7R8W2D0_9CRUS|nr:unnamed protein product [Cyprideis torosa]CAG0880867.1 unnamed protein product [Cyprideis torosa]
MFCDSPPCVEEEESEESILIHRTDALVAPDEELFLASAGQNDEFQTGNFTTIIEPVFCNASLSLAQPGYRVDSIYPSEFAVPLYGQVMPVLLIVTVIANTLIILVLSKRHMRSPTNMVLLAMALADMFTMLFPSPWLFYIYTLENYTEPIHPVSVCYAYVFMQEVMPNLFHTASIWLTLALAIQRYIYVCHPTVAVTWCTLPRVKWAIGWIFFLATLHQMTHLMTFNFKPQLTCHEGRVIESCNTILAVWLHGWEDYYYNLYYWFRVLFVHTLPCIVLVMLNLRLFSALRAAEEKRRRLVRDNRNSKESRKMRDSQSTTFMLIVVVTVFLIVEIPLAVITTLHIISVTTGMDALDYSKLPVMILFSNFVIACSYPINFAIYCGMSKVFRQTFSELFISSTTKGAAEVGNSRYSVANGTRTQTNETVV